MLQITRFAASPDATYGLMRHDSGFELSTVERPWHGNEPSVSCVPAGIYALEPHCSNKSWIGETWALVNHDLSVSHYADPGCRRSAILIHIANLPSQLKGCIAVGDALGWVSVHGESGAGALYSARAMGKFRSMMRQVSELELRINDLVNEYP